MAEYSGQFNYTADNVREYQDTDVAMMFNLLTGGEGVVNGVGENLAVTAGTGLQVSVAAGGAWVGDPAGWYYINDAAKLLTIDAETSGYSRIDTVVLRKDRTSSVLSTICTVKKGTAVTSTPAAPALTQNDTIWEFPLANVLVSGGNTSVAVTDRRVFTVSLRGIDSDGDGGVDASKLDGHEASYFARVNSPVFQTNIATPKIVIPASTTSMEVYQTDNLALIIKNSGTGGIITKSGSPDGFISQDLNGALAPVRTSSLGFGGTVSIVGKSGTANVLIIHGGTNNAMQLRAPSAYFRRDDGTDTLIPVYGESFTNPSSIEYKRAIKAASDKEALDLLRLKVKNYIYKDDNENRVQIGVIAEEAQDLGITYPITYKDGKPDGIDYSKFTPALIKLCQMQQAQIDDLTKRLEALEAAK